VVGVQWYDPQQALLVTNDHNIDSYNHSEQWPMIINKHHQ
jgi:hypothetical protein